MAKQPVSRAEQVPPTQQSTWKRNTRGVQRRRYWPYSPHRRWLHSGTPMICPGRRSRVCTHGGEEVETEGSGPVPQSWCSVFQLLWWRWVGLAVEGRKKKRKWVISFLFHQRNHRPQCQFQQEHQQEQAHKNTGHCRPSCGDMDRIVVLYRSQSKRICPSPSWCVPALWGTWFSLHAALEGNRNWGSAMTRPRSTGQFVEPRPKWDLHTATPGLSALCFP